MLLRVRVPLDTCGNSPAACGGRGGGHRLAHASAGPPRGASGHAATGGASRKQVSTFLGNDLFRRWHGRDCPPAPPGPVHAASQVCVRPAPGPLPLLGPGGLPAPRQQTPVAGKLS